MLWYPKQTIEPQLLASVLRYCGKAQNKDNQFYQEAVSIVKEGSSVRLRGKTKVKKHLLLFNRGLYRKLYKVAMSWKI